VPGGLPPQAIVMQLARGTFVARAMHAATRLGVADALGGGAKTYADVAHQAGLDPDRTRRLLRALASIDVVRDLGAGRFELTPVGHCLRADVPGSMRPMMLMMDSMWGEVQYLPESIRTGKNGFELRHGQAPFTYLAQNPERAAIFNDAMTRLSIITGVEVPKAYDFSKVRHIVDVAGGHGLVVASILKANPHLTGTLIDMPNVVEGTRPLLAREGVADRCEVVAGDILTAVPEGGDLYLLSHIIHDWNDEPARQILRACRRAMGPQAKLLMVDMVLPDQVVPDPRAAAELLFDLTMMVAMGGRERTAGELEALLGTAGLRLERIIPMPIQDKLIEAVPT
jgi:hypothetical protein